MNLLVFKSYCPILSTKSPVDRVPVREFLWATELVTRYYGTSLLDITAPAEGVRSARAGGGYDIFTGTSVAAPFVSGAAALMMEWGIVQGNDLFLYNQRVKAFLCRGAARSPYLSYPNPQWGYGRLNLCGTMNELVNYSERGL